MRDKKRPGDQFTKGKDPAVKYADPKKQVLNVKQQSRRDFLEGSGAAVAAGAALRAALRGPVLGRVRRRAVGGRRLARSPFKCLFLLH